jgi:hypothetical protein
MLNREFRGFPACDAAGYFGYLSEAAALQEARGN